MMSLISLGLTDEIRNAWALVREVYKDGRQRTPIEYARTCRRKKRKGGRR